MQFLVKSVKIVAVIEMKELRDWIHEPIWEEILKSLNVELLIKRFEFSM